MAQSKISLTEKIWPSKVRGNSKKKLYFFYGSPYSSKHILHLVWSVLHLVCSVKYGAGVYFGSWTPSQKNLGLEYCKICFTHQWSYFQDKGELIILAKKLWISPRFVGKMFWIWAIFSVFFSNVWISLQILLYPQTSSSNVSNLFCSILIFRLVFLHCLRLLCRLYEMTSRVGGGENKGASFTCLLQTVLHSYLLIAIYKRGKQKQQ